MARNEEKAMSMLNRWTAMKFGGWGPGKRPTDPNETETISDGERWRRQIVRELGEKISIIQNVSLGEHKIRDLNDEINKLLRDKRGFEKRIKELNGPDYSETNKKILDADGSEVIKIGGYYYFGAAKLLPGVKELYNQQTFVAERKTRHELFKAVDLDYYGYRDDDDGLLESLEKVAEEQARQEEIDRLNEILKGEQYEPLTTEEENKGFISHVVIPTKEEIEAQLLEKKKRDIISKYIDR